MVLPMVLGQLDFTVNKNEPAANTIKDFTVSSEDGIIYPNPKKDAYVSKVKFAALRDRYFCVIVQPDQRVFDAQVVKLDQQRSELSLVAKNLQAIEGQDFIADFKLYIGPQDITYLRSVNTDWQAVVYFGKLNFIAHLLLSLLMFLYGIVRNWGVAIILFSLAIYFALFPLSLKQFKSMRQMQAIQPLLEKLREKYKDDQQRFAREQMALFKEHNINPLGGCLPLLLQIPIFITLYQVLTRTVSLKGAGFLWMKDLSLPDRLFILPISLPLIGNEIYILMGILCCWFFFLDKF
jgi:YidC/Oxa1 family membrane protein insertase